ncbi:hypothetical protein [Burkholderia territorii]|nr:hypothetical protein [Burkholderia territorii]
MGIDAMMKDECELDPAACVVGMTGLGKTYWAQQLAERRVLAGEQVIVLDHGCTWNDWVYGLNGALLSLAEDAVYDGPRRYCGELDDIAALAIQRGHGRTPLVIEFEGAYLRRGGIEKRLAPLQGWLRQCSAPLTVVVDEVFYLQQYEDAIAQILTSIRWNGTRVVTLAQAARDADWLRQFVGKLAAVPLSAVRRDPFPKQA